MENGQIHQSGMLSRLPAFARILVRQIEHSPRSDWMFQHKIQIQGQQGHLLTGARRILYFGRCGADIVIMTALTGKGEGGHRVRAVIQAGWLVG